MSSEHIQHLTPGMAPPMPRLGTLRAVVTQRLASVGHAIWRALEEQGRRRSDRELLSLADRWQQSNPKLARELRSYARGGSTY